MHPSSQQLSGRTSKRRLGEILMGMGLVHKEQLDAALADQQRSNKRLGTILIEHSVIDETSLVRALSEQHGIAQCDPLGAVVDESIKRFIPAALAWGEQIVPLGLSRADGKNLLLLATADPNERTKRALEHQLGLTVMWRLAGETEIEMALARHYGAPKPVFVEGRAEAQPPKIAARLTRDRRPSHELIEVLVQASERPALSRLSAQLEGGFDEIHTLIEREDKPTQRIQSEQIPVEGDDLKEVIARALLGETAPAKKDAAATQESYPKTDVLDHNQTGDVTSTVVEPQPARSPSARREDAPKTLVDAAPVAPPPKPRLIPVDVPPTPKARPVDSNPPPQAKGLASLPRSSAPPSPRPPLPAARVSAPAARAARVEQQLTAVLEETKQDLAALTMDRPLSPQRLEHLLKILVQVMSDEGMLDEAHLRRAISRLLARS